jgi:hypothetical protein
MRCSASLRYGVNHLLCAKELYKQHVKGDWQTLNNVPYQSKSVVVELNLTSSDKEPAQWVKVKLNKRLLIFLRKSCKWIILPYGKRRQNEKKFIFQLTNELRNLSYYLGIDLQRHTRCLWRVCLLQMIDCVLRR